MNNYYDLQALSNSQITDFIKGGIRDWGMKTPFNKRKKEIKTDAMVFGTYMHHRILQPELIDKLYAEEIEKVNYATKEGKEIKKTANDTGRAIIRYNDKIKADAMVSALLNWDSNKTMNALLFDAKQKEKVLLWEEVVYIDEVEYAIPCKASVDVIAQMIDGVALVDYKTTEQYRFRLPVELEKYTRLKSASETIVEFGYHRQAAWYMRGYEAVYGVRPNNFLLIIQDKDYVENIGVLDVSEETMQRGLDEILDVLPKISECIINQQFIETTGIQRV